MLCKACRDGLEGHGTPLESKGYAAAVSGQMTTRKHSKVMQSLKKPSPQRMIPRQAKEICNIPEPRCSTTTSQKSPLRSPYKMAASSAIGTFP